MSLTPRHINLAVLLVLTTSPPALAQSHPYSPVFTPPTTDEERDTSIAGSAVQTVEEDPRPGRGWILGGSLLLAIPFGLSFTGGLGNRVVGGPTRENWLLVPGFGPIFLMAQTTNSQGNVILGLDALSQLGGVAMLVYGLVANHIYDAPRAGLRGSHLPVLAPMVGNGRTGVVATLPF